MRSSLLYSLIFFFFTFHFHLACRFERALSDYNGTRPGDVFVVNFGPHFHNTPEGDQLFKDMVFPVLDEMAALAGEATMVWR